MNHGKNSKKNAKNRSTEMISKKNTPAEVMHEKDSSAENMHGKNNKKIVVLGMSGGVDSSVAALLLKKKGYEVIGVFMKNYSDTKNPITGECAWRDEKRMAEKVCGMLDIPFHMIDYEKKYMNEVILPMFRDYKKGLTPNPDILCNTIIKFPALWKEAKKLGADYIATGHYARVRYRGRKFELLRGKDRKKDQTYFLYQLTQMDLSHTLFPVGDLTKEKVREIARRAKLPNWDKKGTSGICFIGNLDMKRFLRTKIRKKKGDVVSPDGKIVGAHPGEMYFTVGERIGDAKGFVLEKEFVKKLGGEKWYVAKKLRGNKLVIAPEGHELLRTLKIVLKNLHIISEEFKGRCFGRIRHLGKLEKGILKKEKGKWIFEFARGIEGIAEGQFLVLYSGEKVIGGGEMRLK